MIFNRKFYFFQTFFCILSLSLLGKNNNNIIYDIDNRPILLLSDSKKQKGTYYTLDGKKVKVISNVSFEKNKEELNDYLANLYYDHPDYTQQEISLTVFFIILFDNDLKIQEVRISKVGFTNEMKDLFIRNEYNTLLEDILKETSGKWTKEKECWKKYYVYVGSFKII